MEFALTDEDVQLMLAEIQRFCQRSIAPVVERPEQLIGGEQLRRLTDQAIEIGLINLESEMAAGLWENLDEPWGRQFSSQALLEVARVNAGVAFHFHQRALGGFLNRRLETGDSTPTIACIQGRYGLARRSLARLVRGRNLNDDDRRMLRCYFVAQQDADNSLGLLIQAADDWQQILAPVFDGECEIVWKLFPRDVCDATRVANSHGLNEAPMWHWQPQPGSGHTIAAAADDSLNAYVAAMNINAQALVAIGLGALQQGHRRAVEYAADRRQAGRPLNQLAAVQQMLGNGSSTISTVDLLRRRMAELELSRDSLGEALGIRAQVHDLLCAAANDAMQVFGGLGYMQETGLEKIVRDNNHVRLLGGTPTELRLFLAEWEIEP